MQPRYGGARGKPVACEGRYCLVHAFINIAAYVIGDLQAINRKGRNGLIFLAFLATCAYRAVKAFWIYNHHPNDPFVHGVPGPSP